MRYQCLKTNQGRNKSVNLEGGMHIHIPCSALLLKSTLTTNAFKIDYAGRTIDIYLSGLLAVIFFDWKHAWKIEADEYENDC